MLRLGRGHRREQPAGRRLKARGLWQLLGIGLLMSASQIAGAREFLESRTSQAVNAWEVVETLNPRWLRSRSASVNYGPSYARAVVNGTVRRVLADLYRMSTDNIETMRYLSASDATTKYGTGYAGGVIEVTLRRGR